MNRRHFLQTLGIATVALGGGALRRPAPSRAETSGFTGSLRVTSRALASGGPPGDCPDSEGHVRFAVNGGTVYQRCAMGSGGGRGIDVVVLDETSGAVLDARAFGTSSPDGQGQVAMEALAAYLDEVPAGRLVMVGIAGEAGLIDGSTGQPYPFPWVEDLYAALEALGSQVIRHVPYREGWAMVARAGRQPCLAEDFGAGERVAGVDLDPAVAGAWGDPIDSWVVAVHAHLLPTGKVLYWEDQHTYDGRIGELYLWDPLTEAVPQLRPALPGYDLFCSGHTLMADGRLLVTGGHEAQHVGLRNATVYDPFADTWTALPPMNAGRWYPTNTTLPSGDVLVFHGTTGPGRLNLVPQVWEARRARWRTLTRASAAAPHGGALYPRTFVAPDGRVFKAGAEIGTWFLNPSGVGRWTAGPARQTRTRREGAAVYYDGTVLMIGGGDPPLATVESIDLRARRPAWRADLPPMAFARRHGNATLLPDGTTLVTGGTAGGGFDDAVRAVRAAEAWDPAAGRWHPLAAMRSRRLYHSTALLLPDGRVLAGGGGQPSSAGVADVTDFEIFSPPYLFRGPRPAIGAAPSQLDYRATVAVATPDAARIAKVTLVRLGSVTHSFNANQRLLTLSFTRSGGGLLVKAPRTRDGAPPGHYMLFLVDGDGVPSVARIVRLG